MGNYGASPFGAEQCRIVRFQFIACTNVGLTHVVTEKDEQKCFWIWLALFFVLLSSTVRGWIKKSSEHGTVKRKVVHFDSLSKPNGWVDPERWPFYNRQRDQELGMVKDSLDQHNAFFIPTLTPSTKKLPTSFGTKERRTVPELPNRVYSKTGFAFGRIPEVHTWKFHNVFCIGKRQINKRTIVIYFPSQCFWVPFFRCALLCKVVFVTNELLRVYHNAILFTSMLNLSLSIKFD